MSMLWRIMVAVEALVVLVQGYQSDVQTNLVMILVNLLPAAFGAPSEILVSAKCQCWCTWWLIGEGSGAVAGSSNQCLNLPALRIGRGSCQSNTSRSSNTVLVARVHVQ